jgi:hypothetical protein
MTPSVAPEPMPSKQSSGGREPDARREPPQGPLRPIGMRALRTGLVVAALAGTVACAGDRTGPSGGAAHDCTRQATVVARADLDDDGTPEDVRLCAGRLVAKVGGSTAGVDVAPLDLDATRARVVHLHGAGDLVLVPSRRAADGRFQPHLFGAGRQGLTEVLLHGEPVLPPFASEPGTAPMTATCTDGGGVSVVTARAHQPPGIILAWDLTRTTYDVRDGVAVPVRTSVTENAGADPVLRRRMPHLFDRSLFAGCSSAT